MHALLRWCINVAEGLAYLHSQGIIHRDIKCENIFLTDDDVHTCTVRSHSR